METHWTKTVKDDQKSRTEKRNQKKLRASTAAGDNSFSLPKKKKRKPGAQDTKKPGTQDTKKPGAQDTKKPDAQDTKKEASVKENQARKASKPEKGTETCVSRASEAGRVDQDDNKQETVEAQTKTQAVYRSTKNVKCDSKQSEADDDIMEQDGDSARR